MSNTARNLNTNEYIQSHAFYSTLGYMDLSKFKRVHDFLELTLKTDFTREEYLQWRKNWKAIYAELSAVIRNLKVYRSPLKIRELNASINEEGAMKMAASRGYEAKWARGLATELLEMRRLSKEYAQAAYAKSKAE